jgi:hypothetical protein
MNLTALALTIGIASGFTASDQTALSRLRSAVDALEHGSQGAAAFRRLAPPTQIATWKRLQRQVRYPRAGSLDLAFALAYYQVEFRQNVQRLLIPVWMKERGRPVKPSSLTNLPGDLELLYAQRPDPLILRILLDPRLQSICDAGGSDPGPDIEALNNLWSADPVALLRAASGSPLRIKTLAKAINEEYGDKDPAHRGDAAALRKLTRHSDTAVARVARQLLVTLQRLHRGVWPPRGAEPYAP